MKRNIVTIMPWAHDQSKGMERCRPKVQPKTHTHMPRNARECEGMNSHIPKWTSTLGVGFPMDSQIFRK